MTSLKRSDLVNRHLSLINNYFICSIPVSWFQPLDQCVSTREKNQLICKWCELVGSSEYCKSVWNVKLLRWWLSIDLYNRALINLFINFFSLSSFYISSYCQCKRPLAQYRRLYEHTIQFFEIIFFGACFFPFSLLIEINSLRLN